MSTDNNKRNKNKTSPKQDKFLTPHKKIENWKQFIVRVEGFNFMVLGFSLLFLIMCTYISYNYPFQIFVTAGEMFLFTAEIIAVTLAAAYVLLSIIQFFLKITDTLLRIWILSRYWLKKETHGNRIYKVVCKIKSFKIFELKHAIEIFKDFFKSRKKNLETDEWKEIFAALGFKQIITKSGEKMYVIKVNKRK
jgi:hypothetical protein